MEIPTIKQIWQKLQAKEKLTATEEFVGSYRPIILSDHERDEFDRLLKNMINEIEAYCKG